MVYVDNMQAPFQGMIMCHMVADSNEELIDMVRKIGVSPRHIQYPDTYKEHFDICLAKRSQAVKLGAKEITWRQYAAFVFARKDGEKYEFTQEEGQTKLF